MVGFINKNEMNIMNKKIYVIVTVIIFSMLSCKKDEFNLMSLNYPDVPVTVNNLYAMTNGVPTVSTSLSGGGVVKIELSIPENSARTIKEITRVSLATTTTNYKVVQVATGLYNTTPIAGTGKVVTFNTTLAEYTAKTALSVTTSGTATSFLARYFYFLVTLDNGDQLIPVPVRVYVNT